MSTGKVKWFNGNKGYGIITSDTGQEVFVQYSSIKSEGYKTLKDGDSVQFDLVLGDRGAQAQNVTVL